MLLRLIRTRAPASVSQQRVIGIVDWAWKAAHLTGTIVSDLDRHCMVAVLPDRDAVAVAAWLGRHAKVEVA